MLILQFYYLQTSSFSSKSFLFPTFGEFLSWVYLWAQTLPSFALVLSYYNEDDVELFHRAKVLLSRKKTYVKRFINSISSLSVKELNVAYKSSLTAGYSISVNTTFRSDETK